MGNVGRAFGLGAVILAGCADATFDLLPNKADPSSDKVGQSGDTSSGDAAGDTGSGGTTSTGGTSGNGGFGARGGGGGLSDIAGAGNDAACGPSGCMPITCTPDQGCCNRNDDCAAPTAYCSTKHRCVSCRPTWDCPQGENCSRECDMGQVCDGATNTCAPACDETRPCSIGVLLVCQRGVCVECDPNPGSKVGCRNGLKCAPFGQCVQCFSSNDCHDEAKPVCNFDTLECIPCTNDYDCNPSGSAYGRSCDRETGRCVTASPTPAASSSPPP